MEMIRKVMKGMFGIITLCLITSTAMGQMITVKGKITGENENEPISYTPVRLNETNTGAFISGNNTDEEGNYTIKFEKNDWKEITLSTSYTGYQNLEKKFVLEAGKTIYTLDIFLKAKEDTANTVTITTLRNNTTQEEASISVSTIKPEQLDIQATTEIEKTLEYSSGVDIKDGQPNIRGSSGYAFGIGSRVMVMVDGLPILSADAGTAQFNLVPVDNIAQVEIIKGAASVLYGSSAMGGVINIITADAESKPLTSIRTRMAYFGQPANKSLDWDGTSAGYEQSLNVFHKRRINDKNSEISVLFDLFKSSGYRQSTDKEAGRFMLGTKFRPKLGMQWGVNFNILVDSSSQFLFAGSYAPDTATMISPSPGLLERITGLPVTNYDTNQVLINGALVPGPGATIRQLQQKFIVNPYFKYLTNDGQSHWYRGQVLGRRNLTSTGQDNESIFFYNDYQYQRPLTLFDSAVRATWTAGGTFTYNSINGDSLFASEEFGDGRHWSYNAAAFTQIDFKWKRLNATIGGRYDLFNIDGNKIEQSPVFRIGLNYKVAKGTFVRASAGQGFRSPSIAERFTATNAGGITVVPNAGLQVEKGFSAEVGIRQGFKFGNSEIIGGQDYGRWFLGFIDVAAFTMQFDNMIEFGINSEKVRDILLIIDPNTGDTTINGAKLDQAIAFSSINVAQAQINGIEVNLGGSLNVRKFRADLSGGVTFIDPVNKNPATSQASLSFEDEPVDRLSNLFGWLLGETQDNPTSLKYREKLTVRAGLTLSYGNWSLTTNYRGKSKLEAYDQYLNLLIPGTEEFIRNNPGSDILDFIIGYRLKERSMISFHVDNALNDEYIIIPGYWAPQRKYTLQFKYVFGGNTKN